MFNGLDAGLEEVLKRIMETASLNDLQEVKARYLGKQGLVTSLMKNIKEISPEKRKEYGREVNELKNSIEEAIDNRKNELEELARLARESAEKPDCTVPGKKRDIGSYHLITQVMEEVQDIWVSMGFEVTTGPEIETSYYNFEALNTPEWHPARDMHDTFYTCDGQLLRTHTSPVQIRVLESRKPPLAIFSPGTCYRKDTPDTTHLPMFHQFEVLLVDKGTSVSHLKGTLNHFAKRLFGADRRIRLRPSFFPFTEPSFEVDVSCGICGGQGCRSCRGSGWLEILGAGMVHPNVFKNVGYDPEVWSGFALGTGLERIAMLKYDLEDIRDLLRNDRRFLKGYRRAII
ncbi:MAG: phenylalanine--tRNA ligase subunit alpha [Thermotogaceae bacterium]|jgi:phenylalanyl-tRNA synthetase alpha chain|nr:phenylalanine--tRNA ligase subunit alpha [Mesotoga sp.]MDI9374677.1 phenylalanine--tRNA ligase subunit alpha [Thermotogota bacterium]NLX33510.1 phenylalanine--tRNA ligase subunit alpha [Thermotogaceae bacterium]MDD4041570.1 phenylalanine--tRNA ligase subunit alpha [Mesotoga sp.]MDD4478371.1 phenylalanine--tRNA ligase subunit alpha [Mesotoga sp.]